MVKLDDKGWFWKPVALLLMSALITGSGAFIYTTCMFVTKAEAREMIEMAPYPWIIDRKFVLHSLSEIQKDVRYIVESCHE